VAWKGRLPTYKRFPINSLAASPTDTSSESNAGACIPLIR
jgi:hypothetical protein